ncbi:MAG TPA: S8 family serine peptidase [Aggregatilineales bacterium]|nr:S8 family serine peptidase [Aggregatilineales bacterium]
MTIRPRMDQKPRPLHYFVPGQVVLHVTRSAGASDAEIIEQVGKQVSDAQRGVEVPGEFVPRFSAASKRIVSQSVVGDGARRATVVVDLGYGKKPEDIAALVADVNRLEKTFNTGAKLSALAAGTAAQIDSVSLNWLMSGAQGAGGTTGGPGAHPVPVSGPAQPYSETLNGDFPRVDWADLVANSASPGEVNVVVLDTAPPLSLLSARFDELVLQQLPGGNPHPVLHRLLGASKQFNTSISPDGNFLTVSGNNLPDANVTFQVSYNLAKDSDGRLIMETLLNHQSNFEIENHAYLMSDHGLFVAGQIARLVQATDARVKVNIHLVQVLGDYGVGTIETLQQGMNWALDSAATGLPLVINNSLMVNVPRDKGHLFSFNGTELDLDLLTFQAIMSMVAGSMAILEADYVAASSDTRFNGVNIVAAAGNDSVPLLPPVRARFPAAFDSVMGVGAINPDGTRAPYSNEPDNPTTAGAVAYGGEANPTADGWVATDTGGLIGVYLGEFPTPGGMVPSVNGWGAWAGTSFAAPRVAAALAILRSTGMSAAAAAAAI